MDSVQLSREAVQQIRDLMREVKELRREVERLSGRKAPRRLVDDIVLGKPDANIAARSGSSVSSGTVSVWEIVRDSNQITDTTRNVTAWNWSSGAIASGTLVVLGRHSLSGDWMIISADC